MKPVVDRLEQELGANASVVRLDVFSAIGRTAAGRFAVRSVPTFLLSDGQGNILYRQTGSIDTGKVKDLVQQANEGRE